MIRRMQQIVLGLLTIAALGTASSAAQPVDPINTNGSRNLAVRGYDVVAYFTDQRPTRGDARFELDWSGVKWRFASAEHRDLFANDPTRYAPGFGGYCAYAVSRGYTATIVPEAWRIVDGKLYLNYSSDVQREWEKDIPGNISKGGKNWPSLVKR